MADMTVEQLVEAVKEAVDERVGPLEARLQELAEVVDGLETGAASGKELESIKSAVDSLMGARKSIDTDDDPVVTKSARERDAWGRRVRL